MIEACFLEIYQMSLLQCLENGAQKLIRGASDPLNLQPGGLKIHFWSAPNAPRKRERDLDGSQLVACWYNADDFHHTVRWRMAIEVEGSIFRSTAVTMVKQFSSNITCHFHAAHREHCMSPRKRRPARAWPHEPKYVNECRAKCVQKITALVMAAKISRETSDFLVNIIDHYFLP